MVRGIARSRAPTVRLARIETNRTRNTAMDNSKDGLDPAFIQGRKFAPTEARCKSPQNRKQELFGSG
jgi:hypothetical protein